MPKLFLHINGDNQIGKKVTDIHNRCQIKIFNNLQKGTASLVALLIMKKLSEMDFDLIYHGMKQNKSTEISMEYHCKTTSSQVRTLKLMLWNKSAQQRD